eukprot:1792031-Prymnesium_polylepis.1
MGCARYCTSTRGYRFVATLTQSQIPVAVPISCTRERAPQRAVEARPYRGRSRAPTCLPALRTPASAPATARCPGARDSQAAPQSL